MIKTSPPSHFFFIIKKEGENTEKLLRPLLVNFILHTQNPKAKLTALVNRFFKLEYKHFLKTPACKKKIFRQDNSTFYILHYVNNTFNV